MSALSDKTVLDSILASLGTTAAADIEAVAAQITELRDDRLGTPVGATISVDMQNETLAVQSRKYTHPDMANGVVVTGGAGAWGFGVYAEVIATNAVNSSSAVYAVVVEAVTGIHQITLASGLAGAEVPFCQFTVVAAGKYIIQGPPVAANLRIAAKTASKAGGAQTVTIYLETYRGLQ